MKRFLYYSLCAAIFFTFLMASCKNSTQQGNQTQEEIEEEEEEENIWVGVPLEEKDTRSFKVRFDEVIDLMDISWRNMLKADDQKTRHSQKIVSKMGKLGKAKHQKLAENVMTLVGQMENSRYDKQSMTSGEHMNKYDKTLDELILAVQKLKKKVKKFDECEPCKVEYKLLMENNQKDVILRSKHDQYARTYNQMLSDNQAEIKKLGKNYQGLKKEPVFNYGD